MTRSLVISIALALAPAALHAQPADAPVTLDPAASRSIAAQAADLLRSRYVFPEAGRRAAARVEAQRAAGAYDQIKHPAALGARLTADMNEILHDKHLEVILPREGGPPPDAADQPRSEGGVVRADRLLGDIGYLRIDGFVPPLGVFKSAADRAMSSLAGTRALIIDLRQNHGGIPADVAYLVSFFTPGAAPIHIEDIVSRNPNAETFETTSYWSVATPTKYAARPVLILTSHETFSGAEAFSYEMQALKYASTVGETTGGGAHPVDVETLKDGLLIAIPASRSVSALTGSNWEGRGVAPDVSVPSSDALAIALQRLGDAPSSNDINALSVARLFTPRSVAQPGSKAALRNYIEGAARGEPPYRQMTDEWSKDVQTDLTSLTKSAARFGPIVDINFREVDGMGSDLYDVKFANGTEPWLIVLTPDGKIAVAFSPG
jgi:hypothetical protein